MKLIKVLFCICIISTASPSIAENWKTLIETQKMSLRLDTDSINVYDGFVVGISRQEIKELDPKTYLPYVPFLYKCKTGDTIALFRSNDSDFRLNGAHLESPWVYSEPPIMKKLFFTEISKFCGKKKSSLDMELPLQLTDNTLHTFFPKHLVSKRQKITTWIKTYDVVTTETQTSSGQNIARTKVRVPEESYMVRETIDCQTGIVRWHEIVAKMNGRTTTENQFDQKEINDPPGSAGRANTDMLCSMTN